MVERLLGPSDSLFPVRGGDRGLPTIQHEINDNRDSGSGPKLGHVSVADLIVIGLV